MDIQTYRHQSLTIRVYIPDVTLKRFTSVVRRFKSGLGFEYQVEVRYYSMVYSLVRIGRFREVKRPTLVRGESDARYMRPEVQQERVEPSPQTHATAHAQHHPPTPPRQRAYC